MFVASSIPLSCPLGQCSNPLLANIAVPLEKGVLHRFSPPSKRDETKQGHDPFLQGPIGTTWSAYMEDTPSFFKIAAKMKYYFISLNRKKCTLLVQQNLFNLSFDENFLIIHSSGRLEKEGWTEIRKRRQENKPIDDIFKPSFSCPPQGIQPSFFIFRYSSPIN